MRLRVPEGKRVGWPVTFRDQRSAMATVEPPYFGLARFGREWVPSIVFSGSRDRGEFLRLADWLCREFAAEVVERYGGQGIDDKEYWTLRVAGSD